MKHPVYLASQSPRRRELLRQIGHEATLLLAGPEEDAEALEAVRPLEKPHVYVKRVAKLKAKAALARWSNRGLAHGLIVVADTTVALGSSILGKPTDAHDAARMLRALSGQTHVVYTAVYVANTETGIIDGYLSRSEVKMTTLSEEDIASYITSGESMDKAGAYGIQGHAGCFVERIRGSYTGIVGLPLFETRQLLRQQATLAS